MSEGKTPAATCPSCHGSDVMVTPSLQTVAVRRCVCQDCRYEFDAYVTAHEVTQTIVSLSPLEVFEPGPASVPDAH